MKHCLALILILVLVTGCGPGMAEQPVVPSATVFVPDPTSTSQSTATSLPTEMTVPTDTAEIAPPE